MAKPMEQNPGTGTEIAIIGMAGRFPGAKNIDEFWNNLKNGIESLSFFAEEEAGETLSPELAGDPNYVRANGGVLENKEYFDAVFFDYTPIEAEIMAPQVRVFHECAWEALEHAGYDPGGYDGLIGIYAGASSSMNWEGAVWLSGKSDELGYFAANQVSDKDYLSTRIAYKFNLRGPAVAVQSACSTSLVAVHLACQAILEGECDLALAGGVSVTLQGNAGYLYQEGMIRSPDGHCRAFDAEARGTIHGNGAGIVVLKILEDAVADRDSIHAVIRGTAINNDGIEKAGFTAPSRKAQAEVIRTAHRVADLDPETITYVEAHGTGTPLGDPIEVAALTRAFNTEKKGFCAIGSLKTNIGHLDAAAGVAGLIKTVLALKHKQIPPSLHFKTPNPKIDFENSPFYVNTRLGEWKRTGGLLRAGVSSFGIGGTNAHVVLEEAPRPGGGSPRPPLESKEYQLILLSAKTGNALGKMTENLVEYFQKNPGINLADAAYTLQAGRKTFKHRKMLVCSTAAGAVEALLNPGSPAVFQCFAGVPKRKVVFMFPGQGAQYVDMGRDLYRKEPVFRREMDRCFELLEPLTGYDMKVILYPEGGGGSPCPSPGQINRTEIAQPALFIFEYALARLLIGWGIEPDAMMGHSIGEYTAACLSGVLSLEDALALVTLRGQLMQALPGGLMLGVSASEEELKPLLNTELSLAAVNGPSLCVVSGTHEAIDAFRMQITAKGFKNRLLHTSHAFHSKMMDPILDVFETKVRQIAVNKPKIPYISNVTGGWLGSREVGDPAYWSGHIRKTVRFADGLKQLLEDEQFIFVEVGPGNSLSTFVRQHGDRNTEHMVINLVRHPREKVSDDCYLLTKTGQLWLCGITTDWERYYSGEERYRIPLPTYPFEGQRYWLLDEFAGIGEEKLSQKALKQKKKDPLAWIYAPSWTRSPEQLFNPGCLPERALWLVFIDNFGLGSRLVEHLQKQDQEVVAVKTGSSFTKVSDWEYRLDPRQAGDYTALFAELRVSTGIPGIIVHMWGITGMENSGCETGIELVKEAQSTGFFSLLYQARALGKLNIADEIRIVVVADGLHDVTGEEDIYPAKATMLGPVTVIPQEYHNIKCRCIDILLPAPGSRREEELIGQLVTELSITSPDNVIALRGRHRWLRTYAPVFPGDMNKNAAPLKKKGVYLLTGGLGNMGLVLAKYLAGALQARLVLTGGSDFPVRSRWEEWLSAHDEDDPLSSKIKKIRELENLGAEVLVKQADAADETQMQAVVQEAEMKFGPLHGVIHAAGAAGEGMRRAVNDLKIEDCEKQFRPKVYGLLVLEKVLREKSLDFCMVTSSLASVLGGLGFTAYSAANLFMDAFVLHRNRKGPVHWLTVNWDGWKFTDRSGLSIVPREGVTIFKYLLSCPGVEQAVISTRDLQARIDEWVKRGSLQDKDDLKTEGRPSSFVRRNLANPYVPPRSGLEHGIVDIWQKFFGVEPIGITDDFFELGGDSLKAVTVAGKLHKKFDVVVPLGQFFSRPTVKRLSEYIGSAGKSRYSSLESAEEKEYHRLSSAQERLYVLQQMEPGNVGYNQTYVVLLEGDPDHEKLEKTFGALIERHEILRTSLEMIDGEPVQRVQPVEEVEFTLAYRETGENEAKELLRDFTKPFELDRPPFLRAKLLKIGPSRHILMIDMHHLVTDGVSFEIFTRELMAIYGGQEPPALTFHYKDYSEWQNSENQQKLMKGQEEYWLREFAGDIPLLDIPADYTRPAVQGFEGDIIGFELAPREREQLKELGLKEDVTLFMLLLAVFNVFLAKLSGLEDIVVGTPTAGRRHPDLQYIMGIFVNTLALRNQPAGSKCFIDFLSEIKEHTLRIFENQEYQFEDLIDRLDVNRDISRSPLFDVMFVLQNVEMEAGTIPEIEIPGLKLKPYDYKNKTAKFDLTLFVGEFRDKLSFAFQYCTKLFNQGTIERFINYFKRIVFSVLADPGRKISHLEIIPEREKRRILYDFTAGVNIEGQNLENKAIHLWFEEQVLKAPGAGAISFRREYAGGGGAGELVTYEELNRRVNRAARLLTAGGVKQRDIVGILAERSVEMIVAILAVLKTGAAYVPIDPEFPADRIDYMVKDTNMALLVSNPQHSISSGPVPVVFLDMKADEIRKQSKENPGTAVDLQDFAYIIYTSGSTGRPKGTPISHGNLNNYARWFKREFRVTGEDRFCFTGSFCFDMAVTSTVVPLVSGAAIYTVGERIEREPEWYTRYLAENRISIIKLTPTQFKPLSDYIEHVCLDSLRYIILGGEALDANDVRRHLAIYKHHCIVNEYGPTEATVATIFYAVRGDDPFARLPIGRPISGTRVYILDRYAASVPIGVVGEICIGGASTAKGYLNRVELTYRCFMKHPLPGGGFHRYRVLYKTGDMGRYLVDGNIEYLGRIDSQVKIKGYRIELEEIEAVLSGYEGVRECAVGLMEDRGGNRGLVAYVVLDDGSTTSGAKEYLGARLPGYMIPPVFVPLSQLPVAASGKTDREKLPDPASLQIPAGEEYREPTGEKETILANTWKEVLGVDRVGAYDNFFELGGDSIKAIQVISRLRKLQYKLEVNDLFLYPSVGQLKKCLEKAERIGYQGIVEGEVELTPIQHWFFDNYYFNYKKDFALLEHFNQSVMLYRKEGFEPGTVEAVFTGIVRHHDALRMVYRPGDEAGRIVQENRGLTGKLFHLETIDLRGEMDIKGSIEREADGIQRGIDLREGPLLRLGLFKTSRGDHLLIVIHHLVVDGVSWRILLEDFSLGYRQAVNQQPVTFQEKTDSFRHWALELKAYAGSGESLKELEYWRTLNNLKTGNLPVSRDHDYHHDHDRHHDHDHPVSDGRNRLRDRETVSMTLPVEETGKLLRRVSRVYNTEINDILLAGLGLAVKEWAGINRLLVNLEGHGREEFIEDVSITRTVGWYTTQFPVVFDLTRGEELPYFLKLVKETLRNIPKRGIGYGILRYLAPVEKEEIAVEPQISFNYLGEFGQESNENNRMFTFSQYSTGRSVNPELKEMYRLDINGMVVSGKLSVSFNYNKYEYERGGIENLADLYRLHLLRIIEHCISGKERELSPSDLDYRQFTIDELHELENSFRGEDCVIENIYRLAPMQSGMYYHYLSGEDPSLYFEQYEISLKGELDSDVFEKSLDMLHERYDVLRTVFVGEGFPEPVQIVLKQRKPDITFVDISDLEEDKQFEYIDAFKLKDREEGFDLAAGLLMRISLLKTAEDSYKVILSFHHIIMDGWCVGFIFKDLVRLYISLREHRPAALEPVKPYGEFIRWLEGRDSEEGLKFWKNYLAGYTQAAALPKLREPGSVTAYRMEEYGFEIDGELTGGLVNIANENHVTLNTLVQTLWGILLQKINRTTDVVFGGVVSGRPHEIEEVESMVGLFINTIPVRITLTEDTASFSRLAREVQQKSISARSYEYLPLAEIESCSPLKNRLIDHIMIFENYPVQQELGVLSSTNPAGFEVRGMDVFERTNYDFNLFAAPGETISIKFSYNSTVYDNVFVKKVALYFKEVIKQVKENGDIGISEIELIPHGAEVSGDLQLLSSKVLLEEQGDFGF